MIYRHATNLRTPFDRVDLEFLSLLSDYRIGDPVPARAREGGDGTPLTLQELNAQGIVGLYTTDEALSVPEIKRKTGWGAVALLGPEWKSKI